MGTTRTALETTTGITYQTVVAIEGLEYLLTDGPTAAALTAWSSVDDWVQALGGLFVEMQRDGDWDPFNAFTSGASCTLTIAPDAADTLGRQIGRTRAGAATELVSTIDCDATTITVKSTAGFASSGTAFIGTECFSYSGKTSTTFTGVTRGLFTPFRRGAGDDRFAHQHRSGPVSTYQTSLQPVVSQYRRSWKGALVGVWVHRIVNGVLDGRDEAQLVFAGTVEDIYDAGETAHTVIVCKDIQDRIKSASLMRDVFRARITDGMFIPVGTTIEFAHATTAPSSTTATPLRAVIGAPANSHEFTEGIYTVTEFCSIVTQWLAGDPVTTQSAYTLSSPVFYGGKMRTVFEWEQEVIVGWSFRFPTMIAAWLGLTETMQGASWYTTFQWAKLDPTAGSGTARLGSDYSPYRWPHVAGASIVLSDVQGRFVDQYDLMPQYIDWTSIKPPTDLGLDWGIFTLNGEPFIVGAIEESGGTYSLTHVRTRIGITEEQEAALGVRYTAAETPSVELSQIFKIRAAFRDVMLWLFASTGTPGHNHATYDAFPLALALGIPWELLDDAFETSILEMPEGDREMQLDITEPISIEKLFNVDLVLRGLHLSWHDQHLVFRRWVTPTVSGGGAGTPIALTESNKAMPAGNRGTFRTTTKITSQWLTPIVSIMFDRDPRSGEYRDGPLIIEDRVSIDDLGGDAPTKKLEARNMTRADVEAIAPLFVEMAQFYSRPAYIYQRPISQKLFESLTPGELVTITDNFARDPATGDRGMSNIPGIVVKSSYSLGGPEPNDPAAAAAPQVGTIEALVFPFERPSVYSPSGEINPAIDGSGFTKGYNSSTNTIALKAHAYTPSIGAVDASFFAESDEIEITKVDPDDPASPQTWNAQVVSVAGNNLVIDAPLTGYSVVGSTTYRIRSRPYDVAQLSQRANVYEADDADGLILDTGDPYTYALASTGLPSHTAETAPWPAEQIPEMLAGDGAAHDTATDVQLARALNNLMNHKSAHNAPMLRTSVLGHTTASTRRILAVMPVCFGPMRSVAGAVRKVAIAPFLRSSNGTSCTITVTLVGRHPTNSAIDNQVFDDPAAFASWTTSSTTWSTGTAAELSLSVLDEDGVGFLIIEGTDRLETYGLAQVSETEINP